MFFVTWLAFFRQEIPSFPPEGYSLRWFAAIAGNDRFVCGFLLSLQVGVIATADRTWRSAVPAALCLTRFRFSGREALNSLLLLPLVVPGIVLGTALYVFHVETEIHTGLPILGSLGGLIAGPCADRHPLDACGWSRRASPASTAPSRRRRKVSAPIAGRRSAA